MKADMDRKAARKYIAAGTLALMQHLGMTPRTIEVGEKEQNGDVESANGALKRGSSKRCCSAAAATSRAP